MSLLLALQAAGGITEADGSASGSGTATGIGCAVTAAVATAAGVAAAAALAVAVLPATGGASGAASVSGASNALWLVVANAAGVGTALAEGEDAAVPAPGVAIGVVPVRYVLGTTANVVPVETVGAWAIGVVRVREFVGPANVVPVRETAVEVPRVRVVKV